MRKLINLVRLNIRRLIKPTVFLVALTVALHVIAYATHIMGHEINSNRIIYHDGTVVYEITLYFMDNDYLEIWNNIQLGSFLIMVMLLMIYKESDDYKLSIATLPVARTTLYFAKFIHVLLSLFLIHFANYAAMYLQYLTYLHIVPEENRGIFIFDWESNIVTPFLSGMNYMIIISIVIGLIYALKNYFIIKLHMYAVHELYEGRDMSNEKI